MSAGWSVVHCSIQVCWSTWCVIELGVPRCSLSVLPSFMSTAECAYPIFDLVWGSPSAPVIALLKLSVDCWWMFARFAELEDDGTIEENTWPGSACRGPGVVKKEWLQTPLGKGQAGKGHLWVLKCRGGGSGGSIKWRFGAAKSIHEFH